MAENSRQTQLKSEQAQLKSDFEELGQMAKKATMDSLHALQENMSALYERSQDGLSGIEKKIETAIRNRPLQALLLAAGAGFVIGWLKKGR